MEVLEENLANEQFVLYDLFLVYKISFIQLMFLGIFNERRRVTELKSKENTCYFSFLWLSEDI